MQVIPVMLFFIIIIYLFHNKSPLHFFLLHYQLVSMNTVTLFSLCFMFFSYCFV